MQAWDRIMQEQPDSLSFLAVGTCPAPCSCIPGEKRRHSVHCSARVSKRYGVCEPAAICFVWCVLPPCLRTQPHVHTVLHAPKPSRQPPPASAPGRVFLSPPDGSRRACAPTTAQSCSLFSFFMSGSAIHPGVGRHCSVFRRVHHAHTIGNDRKDSTWDG